jgi:FkbM family methyltransferase
MNILHTVSQEAPESTLSSRITSVLAARETLGHDFFGGWQPSDLDLFSRYRHRIEGSPGFLTDYFGVRTSVQFVPWAAGNDGTVFTDPPIPDDGVRAEAIEYFALLDSLENSPETSFSMIELGASYAPWACAGGVLAARVGKKLIVLRAVEASSFFCNLIEDNFRANSLYTLPQGTMLEAKAIHGAVGIKRGTVFFPVVSSAFENGGQASNENLEVDYVGRTVPHESVPVRTLDEIFKGLEKVDLLHCDIQGSEAEVLIHGATLVTQKVRHMFVGTHSRQIEGALIECYHKHGWSLMRERPVIFTHRVDLLSTVGMTIRDGGQYWVNNLVAAQS